MRNRIRVLFAILCLLGGAPAGAECQMDACVQCDVKWNGTWQCKIVWNNRYCNCDASGGAGCYQNGTCRVVVTNEPVEPTTPVDRAKATAPVAVAD